MHKLGIHGPRKGGLKGKALEDEIAQLEGADKDRGFRGVQHALTLKGVPTTQYVSKTFVYTCSSQLRTGFKCSKHCRDWINYNLHI